MKGEIEVIGRKNRKPIKYEVSKNGCWNCTSHKRNDNRYPKLKINGKTMIMSRYIYEQNYGKIAHGLVIRHKCDNSQCINLEHLSIGTQADNITDMVKRGRQHKGETQGSSKLTQFQVNEIRKDDRKQTIIATDYKVTAATISLIRNNKMWKEVI